MAEENADQKAFWENWADHWVNSQADLDGLMAPVLDRVFSRADLRPGQRVLDIGCGAGTSTQLAAEAVAPGGHVTGADISAPMLAQARKSTAGLTGLAFIAADVADHDFGPPGFDRVISRFGVMFFADPQAAFCNIARAMKPGARLSMACWSGLERNPWFRVPMIAAKERLGAPPPLHADAPGPLAFRDINRVTSILHSAGFSDIEGQADALMLTPPGDLIHLAGHAARIGPASRTLEYFEADQADVNAIVQQVAGAFEEYMTPDGARVPAEINFFTATAPQR
ncbi:class I SAM-dependent methyltransferase [Roseobacter ponti]|uniref:Class I SAM-dependent methyltransferase n=1 Tax=Roseobacter ponti TaxID=1891787 RepID=A0A858STE9_9RHOB|nr:class I SAM-dependent methyltransferase [Roseobacter ponti]QJF51277.1 class I SAM-dependent methyltransferase [Roseobacter ponti]